jgi:hypothetical protein
MLLSYDPGIFAYHAPDLIKVVQLIDGDGMRKTA